jgi:hypothetical protein
MQNIKPEGGRYDDQPMKTLVLPPKTVVFTGYDVAFPAILASSDLWSDLSQVAISAIYKHGKCIAIKYACNTSPVNL